MFGSYARTGLPAATTTNAVYDAANRLTSWNGAAVAHDANGNMISQGGLTYAYNARNQLTSVKQGSTTLLASVYDGLGRRVSKTLAGAVTKPVWDGWNLVQERDSKNKVVFNELAGLSLDQVFARIPATGSASWLLPDALGSTVGLADPSGVVQTSYTYEPYGRTSTSGAANTNPFRFTGREEDSTGALPLYSLRARSYSPVLSRFVSEDPIGFAGGDVNLYGYVGQAPFDQVDPLGLDRSGCGFLGLRCVASFFGGIAESVGSCVLNFVSCGESIERLVAPIVLGGLAVLGVAGVGLACTFGAPVCILGAIYIGGGAIAAGTGAVLYSIELYRQRDTLFEYGGG